MRVLRSGSLDECRKAWEQATNKDEFIFWLNQMIFPLFIRDEVAYFCPTGMTTDEMKVKWNQDKYFNEHLQDMKMACLKMYAPRLNKSMFQWHWVTEKEEGQ